MHDSIPKKAFCARMLNSALGVALVLYAQADPGKVTLIRTPHGGIQPQAAVDSAGVLHLLYFKGEPQGGDVFYVRREPGRKEFSSPMRVNRRPGSAIAMGTVRGAHLALGKN